MKRIWLVLSVFFFFVSCESDKELTLVSQEESIENYIVSNYPENDIVRSNGANRVILTEGYDVKSVAKGDSVSLLIEGYTFESAPSKLFLQDSIKVAVEKDQLVQGLYDGLLGAELYEQSLIIFSAKYGYYDDQVGIIPSMTALLYNVLITDIKKK